MTLNGYWREEEETVDINNPAFLLVNMLPTHHDILTDSTNRNPQALGPREGKKRDHSTRKRARNKETCI